VQHITTIEKSALMTRHGVSFWQEKTMNPAMNPIESLFETADGLRLRCLRWSPTAAPTAVIVVTHGMGEHAGRYQRFAERCMALGLGVVAADLRGHGKSPGEQEFVERFDDYLNDLDALFALAHADARAAKAPMFLFGHSMGGAIVLRWLNQRPTQAANLAGVMLSSAALQVGAGISPLLLVLAPLISKIAPRLRTQPLDPASMSRIADEVTAYVNDPLVCHRPPPARTAAELLNVMPLNLKAASDMRWPLYVLHGDADALTSVDGARAVHAAWAGADKTLRIWPGGYHELLNDLDGELVAEELLAWVLKH
jgi:alpha-beta hydrolase superfamily lysophospholipase